MTSLKWMPIESAPRDGSMILVYPPTWYDRHCSMAKWDDDRYAKRPRPYWKRADDLLRTTISRDAKTTHWMPLPEPPEAPGEA
jgi:hypothetical protein